jgi:hypothetical protein
METTLLAVVRRSDDGEVAERQRTEWHSGTTLQSKREKEKGCLSTTSSPGAGWRRRRWSVRPESTATALLPAARLEEERGVPVDWGHPRPIPSARRVVAARRSRGRPQRSLGMTGAAGLSGGRRARVWARGEDEKESTGEGVRG